MFRENRLQGASRTNAPMPGRVANPTRHMSQSYSQSIVRLEASCGMAQRDTASCSGDESE